MPPRKSGASVATNGDAEVSTPAKDQPKQREGISVEDLNMPRTMIGRLSKGVLPPNTQIQKDALTAISKSATVFVNFIAAAAAENAQSAGKKTIMPHDVFAALKDQEFEAFIPRVQAETTKYNEIQCDKRNTYRRTKKAENAVTTNGGDTSMTEGEAAVGTNGDRGAEDGERPMKKVRRELGDEGGEDGGEAEDVEDDDVADEEESEEEDVEDEEVEDDVIEPDEVDEPDEGGEQGDGGDGALNGIRDEALDEPDSD